MNLLFLASRDDKSTKNLGTAIRKVIPESKIERFKRIRSLLKKLRTPVDPESIAVLSAFDQKELRKMQILREWLPEIYVILVVPDRKARTIKLAHLLLPRFISQRDESFSDLQVVLDKMYRTAH